MNAMQTLSIISGYLICVLVGVLGIAVVWRVLDGTIDLSALISEPNGDASMSRFQFLIFTFVIALSLFFVITSTSPAKFPDVPGTILSLLGISGSSYLVSKGIQFSDPAGLQAAASDIVLSPVQAVVPLGKTQQFTADIPRKPGSKVKWELVAGPGSIDENGLYRAPATPPSTPQTPASDTNPEAPTHWHATIQVTSLEMPDAHDLAVVTLV